MAKINASGPSSYLGTQGNSVKTFDEASLSSKTEYATAKEEDSIVIKKQESVEKDGSNMDLEFDGNDTSDNETPNLISSTGGMKSHRDLIKIRDQ